jgi:hypothetical protein
MLTNPTHASENITYISKCDDQTTPMPAKTQDASKMWWQNPPMWASKHWIHFTMCWPNPPMTQNVSQLLLKNPSNYSEDKKCCQHMIFKPTPCQGGHKNYLYMCLPNLSHASENTKIYLNMYWPKPSMPARTENPSQHVFY